MRKWLALALVAASLNSGCVTLYAYQDIGCMPPVSTAKKIAVTPFTAAVDVALLPFEAAGAAFAFAALQHGGP